MRAALYARYSTDMQNPRSVADQLRLGRAHVQKLGLSIDDAAVFHDEAITGYVMAQRPGLLGLLAAAERGEFDVLVAEHTNRIARGADLWSIFNRLKFVGVAIETVVQGRIGTIHVGVDSLQNELGLEDLAYKTRRGLEGAALAGRVAGLSYGYRKARRYDAEGERIKGAREIVAEEAEVVVRILTEYAAGLSPETIAGRLNADAIPGPTGGLWSGPTIRGSPEKGTGIINNELYRGVWLWGKATHHKNRTTGQVVKRLGPVEKVVRVEVPDLRVVPDQLWDQVQARQAALRRTVKVPAGYRAEMARRPKRLLSGLVRCGLCDRPMILHQDGPRKSAPDLRPRRWLCQTARTYGAGACPGNRTARADALEARVLAALADQLLHPDAVEAYVAEYRAEMARLNAARERGKADAERELAQVRRAIARDLEVASELPKDARRTVLDKIAAAERRREILEAEVAALPKAEVIALHPSAAGRYRAAIADLLTALDGPQDVERAQAREAVRALVQAVYIHPEPKHGEYRAEIVPNLAPIFPTAAGDAAVRLIA
jgi:site-specific DNA recombinase